MSLTQSWVGYRTRVESVLAAYLPFAPALEQPLDFADIDGDSSPWLNQGMHYACLNGGKRLRAALVYAAGERMGAALDRLDPVACALEMLHAYSLVHDDLPAMDDDDVRRGKPTVHKQFGEATAILVGDALQSLSFQIISESAQLSDRQKVLLLQCLSRAAGAFGMCAGQDLDIRAQEQHIALQSLKTIHRLKTGALIQAAVVMGGLCAEQMTPEDHQLMCQYGSNLGLAFQIVDDILDATADSATIGKSAGNDERLHKVTYVSSYGVDGARTLAEQTIEQAIAFSRQLPGDGVLFEEIAQFVVKRSY